MCADEKMRSLSWCEPFLFLVIHEALALTSCFVLQFYFLFYPQSTVRRESDSKPCSVDLL